MRLAAALTLLALFAVTTLVPSPDADARAARHFDRHVIERGRQRAFERRCIFWARTAVQLVLLSVALATARGLADRCRRACRGKRLPATLLFGAALFLAYAIVDLPFAVVAGWAHPRAWGLTHRAFSGWLGQYVAAWGLVAAVGAVALIVLHLLLRRFPRRWWIPAGAGAALLGCGLSLVYPIWVAPLFNDFTPLADTPYAHLEPVVRDVAARGGVPVDRVVVMDASRQGRFTNAYFSGIGATRSIALYDTLLASHPPAEVASIVAHEVGHWRRGHVWKQTLLSAAGGFAVCFAAAYALRRAVGRAPLALENPADPAGLPLLLLVLWLAFFVGTPIESAVSRRFERQADADAIALTGDRAAFIASEKRLVEDNIADPAPPPAWAWMFGSHPTPVERIEAALQADPE